MNFLNPKNCLFLILIWSNWGCSTPQAQLDTIPELRLTPLRTGVCHLGADHVLGGDRTKEERIEFYIYSFLIEGKDQQRVLVDFGPISLPYTNAMFRRHGFFRDLGEELPSAERFPDDVKQPEGNVFDQLEEKGLSPDDIGHVIYSHLHADHHGIDDAKDGGAGEKFTKALFYVSRLGWEDNLSSKVNGRWNSYVDYAFSDFLVKKYREGRVLFQDNRDVIPGVGTLYLGGHEVCSQATFVNTRDGVVIIASDEIYLYELLRENILPEIRTSKEKYRKAIEKIVRHARQLDAIIVPMHDPIVWKTFLEHGENWIKELKKHSDLAIEGYLKSRK